MKCFYVQSYLPSGATGWSELVDVADAYALLRLFQSLGGIGVLQEFSRTRQREVDEAFASAGMSDCSAVVLNRGCQCGKCVGSSSTTINLVRVPGPGPEVRGQKPEVGEPLPAEALPTWEECCQPGLSAASASSAVEMPGGATADNADNAEREKPSLLAAVLDKAAAFALALLGSPQPRKDAP